MEVGAEQEGSEHETLELSIVDEFDAVADTTAAAVDGGMCVGEPTGGVADGGDSGAVDG